MIDRKTDMHQNKTNDDVYAYTLMKRADDENYMYRQTTEYRQI